jgi:hypothetical protein
LDCGEITVASGSTEWSAYTAKAAVEKFAYASTTDHWAALSGFAEVNGIQ